MTRGVDVSRYQGFIDWEAMPSWIEFVYIGTMDWRNNVVDRAARANAVNASRTRTTGGYYRVDATRRSPRAEAQTMMNVIDSLGLMLPGNLFPAVDIEPTDDAVASGKVDWEGWSAEFSDNWYSAAGAVPLMVYGSGSFLRDRVKASGRPEDWDSRTRFWVGHTAKWATPKGQTANEFAGKTNFTFDGRTAIHQFDLEAMIPGSPLGTKFDRNQLMAGVTLDAITIPMAA